MSLISQFCRLSNIVIGGYRNVIHGRPSWIRPIQTCTFSRKSAEERLGIEKPKRPLTPFFKFMQQMRPALLAKNPGITQKEAIAWSSKHWQELDSETKAQMIKEYQKDGEDYKKIKAMYEASLTDEQKEEIKKVKEEMAAAKEKRKVKAEYKELGKPKRPMSSYFLFIQSRKGIFQNKELFQAKNMKQFQEKIKQEWLKLSQSARSKFEKEAQELMKQYKKDLEAWEMKMVSQGRSDLIRVKPDRVKKPKEAKKAQ